MALAMPENVREAVLGSCAVPLAPPLPRDSPPVLLGIYGVKSLNISDGIKSGNPFSHKHVRLLYGCPN